MQSRWAISLLFFFCALLTLEAGLPVRTPAEPGVVVMSAAPLGAAARIGLRPGDVLLTYRRPAVMGPLRTCTDLVKVEIEQAPQGPVDLEVLREGKVSTAEMPAGDWLVEVVPRSPGGAVSRACGAYARARRLTRERRWDEARSAWATAARWAAAGGDEALTARVLQEQGVFLTNREDFKAAEAALRESLRRLRRAAPDGLAEAATWHLLGRLEQRRGAFNASVADFRRALDLRARLAPESLERASTLNNLGIDAWFQGKLAEARSFYLEALALIRRRAAGSLDEGRVLNNLGLLARDAGEHGEAANYLTAAGRIWRRLDPSGEDLARAYANLGALACDAGDLARSEEYQREALRRFEALAPEGLETAKILSNLAMIARGRFDLAEAELLLRRALTVQHRLIPGSLDEAVSLSTLSWVTQAQGRLDEAESLSRRALAIRQRSRPGSDEVAVSLGILSGIALDRGDLRRAERFGEQALAIRHRIGKGTIQEGELYQSLSGVALAAGRWEQAASRARQALAISRRLAPSSRAEAEALHALGRAVWRSGQTEEAAPMFAAALDALDAQIGGLGGTDEARSGFRAQYARIYQDLIALDIERGRPAEALHILERRRARVLLAQIAQRDLVFSADVPKPLLERQRALDREYERIQGKIARADPEAPEVQELLVRLSGLRNERSALVERIARASPHYASLRYPQPLDLDGARATLDPGTVWLSYAVGEDATFLFVVTSTVDGGTDGLQVFRLPIGEQALEEEVTTFRGLILRGREDPTMEEALRIQGRKLFAQLIAPAVPWIERAERVLISPEGPLDVLPFAALVRPGEGGFLVEWKPVHTVLSATLYAELKRGRREVGGTGAGPLVAFADPLYRSVAGAKAAPGDPPLRCYRAGLPPLPGSREEVRALAALFPAAVVYTGAAATGAQLAHLPVRPRYLHLACHALLDRRFPLDSGLALATPQGAGAEDSGLLQAWQIFEKVRLDADLVTLSACGTGLGREAAGEGLIGLSRAFQYAGARSILASLWGVSDRSTPTLMARFYTLLRQGRPKDVALAEAQRELLRGGRLAHPYSWAGFELSGDWR
jgi:CHAT domain-containing protein/Tfp pilus assembly protein PilF